MGNSPLRVYLLVLLLLPMLSISESFTLTDVNCNDETYANIDVSESDITYSFQTPLVKTDTACAYSTVETCVEETQYSDSCDSLDDCSCYDVIQTCETLDTNWYDENYPFCRNVILNEEITALNEPVSVDVGDVNVKIVDSECNSNGNEVPYTIDSKTSEIIFFRTQDKTHSIYYGGADSFPVSGYFRANPVQNTEGNLEIDTRWIKSYTKKYTSWDVSNPGLRNDYLATFTNNGEIVNPGLAIYAQVQEFYPLKKIGGDELVIMYWKVMVWGDDTIENVNVRKDYPHYIQSYTGYLDYNYESILTKKDDRWGTGTVYGKTSHKMRVYRRIPVVTQWIKYENTVSSPRRVSFGISDWAENEDYINYNTYTYNGKDYTIITRKDAGYQLPAAIMLYRVYNGTATLNKGYITSTDDNFIAEITYYIFRSTSTYGLSAETKAELNTFIDEFEKNELVGEENLLENSYFTLEYDCSTLNCEGTVTICETETTATAFEYEYDITAETIHGKEDLNGNICSDSCNYAVFEESYQYIFQEDTTLFLKVLNHLNDFSLYTTKEIKASNYTSLATPWQPAPGEQTDSETKTDPIPDNFTPLLVTTAAAGAVYILYKRNELSEYASKVSNTFISTTTQQTIFQRLQKEANTMATAIGAVDTTIKYYGNNDYEFLFTLADGTTLSSKIWSVVDIGLNYVTLYNSETENYYILKDGELVKLTNEKYVSPEYAELFGVNGQRKELLNWAVEHYDSVLFSVSDDSFLLNGKIWSLEELQRDKNDYEARKSAAEARQRIELIGKAITSLVISNEEEKQSIELYKPPEELTLQSFPLNYKLEKKSTVSTDIFNRVRNSVMGKQLVVGFSFLKNILNKVWGGDGNNEVVSLKEQGFFTETKELINQFNEIVSKIDMNDISEYDLLALDIYAQTISERLSKWENLTYLTPLHETINKERQALQEQYLETRKAFEKSYLDMLQYLNPTESLIKKFDNFDMAVGIFPGIGDAVDLFNGLVHIANALEKGDEANFYTSAGFLAISFLPYMSASQKGDLAEVIAKRTGKDVDEVDDVLNRIYRNIDDENRIKFLAKNSDLSEESMEYIIRLSSQIEPYKSINKMTKKEINAVTNVLVSSSMIESEIKNIAQDVDIAKLVFKEDMEGYARHAINKNGVEEIHINLKKMTELSEKQITAVLLEEYGHSVTRRYNNEILEKISKWEGEYIWIVNGKPVDIVWNEAHDLAAISLYKNNPELYDTIRQATLDNLENDVEAIKLIKNGQLNNNEMELIREMLIAEKPFVAQWISLDGAKTNLINDLVNSGTLPIDIMLELEDTIKLSNKYSEVMEIVRI